MNLEELVVAARADFAEAPDAAALENAKAKYLGKTGQVTDLMKGLGKVVCPHFEAVCGACPLKAACPKIGVDFTAQIMPWRAHTAPSS